MSLYDKIVELMLRIPRLQGIRIAFYFYDSFILKFIKKPVKEEGAKKKVVIVFTHALGDAVMFYSSIPYIHEVFPKEEYDVYITCHQAYVELFKGEFSNIIPIDYRKVNTNMMCRARFLKTMREMHFDYAMDPLGAEECTPNIYAMNALCADNKIGVLMKQSKKYQCPTWLRDKIYTKVVFEQEGNMHRVKHYCNFWSCVDGKERPSVVAKLPIENTLDLPKEYMVIYPSASAIVKMWGIDNYAWVARQLYKKKGYILVCCGTENDRAVSEEFISCIQDDIPYINLVGNTSIMELIEVVGRSKLVITNDTSVYHIAVATGRKTCVVSGAYAYDMFLNYIGMGYGEEVEKNTKIVAHDRECKNCNNYCIHAFTDVYPCVREIRKEEVLEVIEELLTNE